MRASTAFEGGRPRLGFGGAASLPAILLASASAGFTALGLPREAGARLTSDGGAWSVACALSSPFACAAFLVLAGTALLLSAKGWRVGDSTAACVRSLVRRVVFGSGFVTLFAARGRPRAGLVALVLAVRVMAVGRAEAKLSKSVSDSDPASSARRTFVFARGGMSVFKSISSFEVVLLQNVTCDSTGVFGGGRVGDTGTKTVKVNNSSAPLSRC
jgi:hypothetical protein